MQLFDFYVRRKFGARFCREPIVSNAVEGLDLDGVNFFLAATEEEGKTLEPVIRASGARYVFIDKEK